MSLNAATIEILIAKGLNAADLLEVARATEVKADPTNAERQARHRAKKRNAVTVTDEPPLKKEIKSPTPTTEPSGSYVGESARKSDPFPCPDGVDPAHWRDLKANRKAKRLANTPTAHKQILREIAKFTDDEWPPGRIVEFAAAAGWAGIFDPRKNFRTQENGRSATNGIRGTRPSPALEMYKRAVAQEAAERGDSAPDFGAWPSLPAIGPG